MATLREIAIVVLSILIAFSLDAWWDSAREERDTEVMLQNLRTEFVSNRIELVERIALHVRMGAAARGLVSLLEATDAETVAVPDSLISALFVTPTFDPATGSLEGVLASGALRLVSDPTLRQELAGWAGLLQDATEDEGHALELSRRELLPTIGRHAGITRAIDHAWPWARGEPLPPDFIQGSVRLPASSRLLNLALLRSTYAGWATSELEVLLVHLDRIVTLLDSELD